MKIAVSFLIFVSSLTTFAQDANVFLDRAFWKTNPSVEEVRKKVNAGNDATELNSNAFDATVYALLEKANTSVVKYLLSLAGNPIEKRTHDSRTYLFWAAYAGNTEVMEYLLDNNAEVNIMDSHGNTPLTFAASTGQTDNKVYELFETYGVVISKEKNEEGASPLLLIAPYVDSFEGLAYFVQKGIKLSSTDTAGNGLFEYAAKGGNIALLNALIAKGVAYKNTKGKGGNAILFASAGRRGHQNSLDFYQYLERIGVQPNVTNEKGRNPLHRIAYKNNDPEIFEFFILKGVAVNQQDAGGNSPFMNAATSNEDSIVKLLYPYVKDVNAQDENGRSALSMAINRNTTEVTEFLIEKGADLKVKDKEGNSLAYYLLNTFDAEDTEEFESKMAVLKINNFNFKALQNNNNTLLHTAAKRNNLALLKRIIGFNYNINAKNSNGLTPLHIAAMTASSIDILEYLVRQGADKTITTDFDETVFELAIENELLKKESQILDFLK